MAAEEYVDVGDDVIVVGAPYGRALSVSSGIVSQLEMDEQDSRIQRGMKTDAPIGYGASGGGVFAVPSGAMREVATEAARHLRPADGRNLVISASKGLEDPTGLRMSPPLWPFIVVTTSSTAAPSTRKPERSRSQACRWGRRMT